MNGDFNLPTLIGSYRSDFLDQIRETRNVVATMFDGSIAYDNPPVGAVKFTSGVFSKWSGSAWVTQPLGLGGGGTGATTAAGARIALSVYSQAEIDTLANSFNTAKADKTITVSAGNGLTGGGDLSASRTISGVDATTSVKGVVQLNNTVTSTSTAQAATANAVKVAYDKAVEAETTTAVLAAIAGASVGAIGTYAMLIRGSSATEPGAIVSYTDLLYSNADNTVDTTSPITRPDGDWRCMGFAPAGSATLWLRIS